MMATWTTKDLTTSVLLLILCLRSGKAFLNRGYPIRSLPLATTTITRTSTRSSFPWPFHATLADEEELAVVIQEDDQEQQEGEPVCLGPGTADGYFVIREYPVIPIEGVSLEDTIVEKPAMERLQITPTNLTTPIALMIMDPESYPSMSKARKACRKGNICCRQEGDDFDTNTPIKANVGDRIYPGTILLEQERVSNGAYGQFTNDREIPANVPVIFEDDAFAIVHKPPGMLVYDANGYQRNTLQHMLLFILKPPSEASLLQHNDTALDRPILCHRLDKATGGLMIIAKTKKSVAHLCRQFEERTLKKTYTAILNGKPDVIPDQPPFQSDDVATAESLNTTSSTSDDNDIDNDNQQWHLAENEMDGKHASTLWRVLRYQSSPLANNETLTVVELKPKTGRYHQLRRQMAWLYNCPIVGDPLYGGQLPDGKRFGRGLMLCANQIRLEHPYGDDYGNDDDDEKKQHNGDGWIQAEIDLPSKFHNLLTAHENKWRYRNPTNHDNDAV